MSSPDSPSSNPYESPPIKSDAASSLSGIQILGLITLGVMLIPAAAIAFFATCLGTVVAIDDLDRGMPAGLLLGSVVGTILLGFGIYGIHQLAKRWYRLSLPRD